MSEVPERPLDKDSSTRNGDPSAVPTAEAAEDIGKTLSKKDSARLRRMADAMFWRAFTQGKEK